MGSVITALPARNSAATLSARYDDDDEPLPAGPSRVGRYQIREVLGSGAMGVVYRAHDPDLGRDVAIKLVRDNPASPASHRRLLREAQAMARLHHPNVVPIFDVGPAGSAVFVAMPLIEGGTLKRWLRGGARPLDEILDRFLAAGRGLAAAHAAGLVHRDFKPDNVLLGAGGEIHVADFGLARFADDEPAPPAAADPAPPGVVTQVGAVLGTPAYMAPEQLRGRPIDGRADQFSFCVALWEAVFGQRPFPDPPRGDDHPWAARLDAIAAGPAPARRDRPPWLAPLLVRGLAGDPGRRWPSLQVLLDAIAAHRGPRRWPRRLAGGAGAVGLAAMVVLGRPAPVEPAAAVPIAQPAPAAPIYSIVPLAHLDDLQAAAISPDGARFAFVAGDSLVIQGTGIDAADRTVIEHGVTTPIAWSPDSRHLVVGRASKLAGVFEAGLVDIADGAQRALPMGGMATFLSDTEIGVVTSYRHRQVQIYRVGDYAAPAATCDVPGDYTFLWRTAGLPDGTMVVETMAPNGAHHALVILRRDCRVRATFAGEFSRFAVTDTGAIVALAVRHGFEEILEISLDGEIVARRRISGAVGELIGRRHGVDYVTTFAPKSTLVRVHRGQSHPVFPFAGNASFELAPDGETVAWIERDGRGQTLGSLWLSTLHDMARSRAVLDNALTVGWSPDGRRLAVLVADDADVISANPRPTPHFSSSLVVVERSSALPRRLPLADLDPDGSPVWLDDHRIAVRTDDRTTYRWLDLDTGDAGDLVDRRHGSTLWLTRSPLDGTLAMWRMGAPGAIDAHTERLWIQPPGRDARPLHVRDIEHFLIPSWSPSGELLVRAFETGVVSRVALDTGALMPVARLKASPPGRLFDDHVMVLPGGDLLAVDRELGANIATLRIDEVAPALARRDPDPGQP